MLIIRFGTYLQKIINIILTSKTDKFQNLIAVSSCLRNLRDLCIYAWKDYYKHIFLLFILIWGSHNEVNSTSNYYRFLSYNLSIKTNALKCTRHQNEVIPFHEGVR